MLRRKFKNLSFLVSFMMACTMVPKPNITYAITNDKAIYTNNFEGSVLPNEVGGVITKDKVNIKDVDGNKFMSFNVKFDGTDNWDNNKHEFAFFIESNNRIEADTKVKFNLLIPTEKKDFNGIIKHGTGSSDGNWGWVSGSYGDITADKFIDLGNGYSKVEVETSIGESNGLKKLVLQIASYNCDYEGEILIDDISIIPKEKEDTELPSVKPIEWNFDNESIGTSNWNYGGSWDYTGGDVPVSYDKTVGEGALKLDVNYINDISKSWSEVKIQNNLAEAKNFNGYNELTYDFIYDSNKLTTGNFKTKLFITGLADKSMDIDTDSSEDIGNGLKKVKVKLEFTSKNVEVSSIIIGIIGSSTNYSGPIYIDNISFRQTVAEDVYVSKMSETKPQSVIDVSTLNVDSSVRLVDSKSTSETANLYAYLKAVGKEDKALYGHQNDTHHKAVLKESGTNSDTKDLTGSLAAIVGIDTLSLTGAELQLSNEDIVNGVTLPQKAAQLGIEAANEGSIITMSAHMPNFGLVAEKGKDSNGNYDYSGYTPGVTTGDVVSRIMPGGDLNEVYTGYLNIIAEYASILEDEGVPVLFRPFHENNGSWFWWGKAFCDEEGYKNLFRYTVEYLRDTKDVHNFLYVYSPNGPFENEQDYLSRYPGDEFIDIIAFDMYHDNPTENAEEDPWMNSLKETIELVQGIADKRGKLSAVSETGIRKDYGCMPVSGNPNKDWFSDVSNIVAESNMPYYMVWANFDEGNIFAPYMVNENKGHEMINSFIDYYNEESSVFADGVGDYKSVSTTIGKEYSYGYITSPASRSRILNPTKITVSIKNLEGEPKFVLRDNLGNEIITLKVTLNGGNYEAYITREILDSIGEKTGSIELYVGDKVVSTISAIFNIEEKESPKELVDDFEGYYGESVLLENNWATNVGPGCSLTPTLVTEKGKFNEGKYGLAFNYKISTEKTSEGWAGMTKAIGEDWSEFDALQFWIYPDGKAQKLVIQVTTNGEDFEVFLPELAGTTEPQLVTLKFSDFVGKKGGTIDLSSVERFGIWCNTIVPEGHVGKWNVESTMYFDSIKAINTSNLPGNPGDNGTTEPNEPSNPGDNGTTKPNEPSNPGDNGTTEPNEPSNPGDNGTTKPNEPSNPGDNETTKPDNPNNSESNEEIIISGDSETSKDKNNEENLPNTGGVNPLIPLTAGSALIYVGSIIRRKRNN